MSISPHISPDSPDFPGDRSPQPIFGVKDSLRSIGIYAIGLPHLAAWAAFVTVMARITDIQKVDGAIKQMTRAVPALAGVKIQTEGQHNIDPAATYVYVVNHVNIMDMFAIYQSIPGYVRSLEHASHFSWPIFGAFIRAAGQIPVDPADPKLTARGLQRALEMLQSGTSLVVLPEGQRTLDGTVGPFYPGAFRLAIRSQVPVVPMAIHGGRQVSRRGDWRIRPGRMSVLFGTPIPTDGLRLQDVDNLSRQSRDQIISLLQICNDPR